MNQIIGTTPSSLRKAHRGMMLSDIQRQPGISRSELARRLGLSDMAATRIIRELLGAGIVQEVLEPIVQEGEKRTSVGRPKIGLRVREGALFGAGITLSAYHSEVSIADSTGRIIATKKLVQATQGGLETVAHLHAAALARLIAEQGLDINRFVGVGVALAAKADPATGAILNADYFGWAPDNGQFHDIIADTLGIPVDIENISIALAKAEMRFGCAQGISDFALLHIATLAGACIMSGGTPVRGNVGLAGGCGHLTSETVDLTCICGRNDCLNLSATGFSLLAQMGALDHTVFAPDRIEQYADHLMRVIEDGSGRAGLSSAGRMLGPLVDAIAHLLDPEIVILSGYVGAQPEYLGGAQSACGSLRKGNQGLASRIVAGSIAPLEAAPLLALSTRCYSEELDFERFRHEGNNTVGASDG